jgi:hypothetical protein
MQPKTPLESRSSGVYATLPASLDDVQNTARCGIPREITTKTA